MTLKRFAAIVMLLLVTPVAAFTSWDAFEEMRLTKRLDALYPWVDAPDGKAPVGDPLTPEQQEAARLYAEAAQLAGQSSGRPFLESARTIDALSGLTPAEAARDPRVASLREA